MTGEQAHRDALAAFLDRQYRQVWAVDRRTGERVFIDWGGATPEVREHAKANLRCPVPGCDLRISARGRSKRDHFFHLGRPGHGEGEGEWHLQAKALLTEWANTQPGVTAQEEGTVSVGEGVRVRRADVMGTWTQAGTKVALEVEYKDYKPEHWAAKQADYDEVGVGCSWVFGHLSRYLRQPRKPPGFPEDGVWDRLRWVELTAAVARAGRAVLFINPVERAIVTAVQQQEPLDEAERDRDWWRYADCVGTRFAHPDCPLDPVLILDPLDRCHLDPERGLVSPTMLRVEAEREHIRQRAEVARATHEALAAAALKRRQAQQVERQRAAGEQRARQSYAQQKAEEEARNWRDSPLRSHLVNRYGGRLPHFLDCELSHDRGIYADPSHWHSQLFADLVLGRGPRPMIGRKVTMRQVYAMIGQHFEMPDPRRRFVAITDYLNHLRLAGILAFDTEPDGSIGPITVLSDGSDLLRREREEQQRAEQERQAQLAERARLQDLQRIEHERLARLRAEEQQRLVEARAQRDAARLQRETDWRASSLRSAVMSIFGGIPLAIQWSGGTDKDAIAVHHALWHTHIYLAFIHQRPPGFQFTALDAVSILERNNIPFAGDRQAVERAVSSYLFNLGQRRILRYLSDEEAESPHAIQSVLGPLPAATSKEPEATSEEWHLFG